MKPLLLMDIDGVLNPFVSAVEAPPPGYERLHAAGQPIVLSTAHGPWLHELSTHYELVWASTWEAQADAVIAPLIGAPRGLPTLAFPDLTDHGWTDKFPAIKALVVERSFAWVDDQPGDHAVAWALQRDIPTLIVVPDGAVGWQRTDVERLTAFALGLPRPED